MIAPHQADCTHARQPMVPFLAATSASAAVPVVVDVAQTATLYAAAIKPGVFGIPCLSATLASTAIPAVPKEAGKALRN